MPSEAPNWAQMAMYLAGGLALFLFGMRLLSRTLTQLAGRRLRVWMSKVTGNRVGGALAGVGITAVFQSSSITTVIVVGLVSAGLMSLQQSLGVVLGAGLGATVMVQLIAFKLTQYSLWAIVAGYAVSLVKRWTAVRRTGELLLALGLVFFGMQLMGDGVEPLSEYQPFVDLMREARSPLYAIGIGAVFTAIVQTSSATLAIVISLAGAGLVSVEVGIALVFGANIGTCVTAGLAAIGRSREAVRVAVAQVLFKIAGVLILVWLIPQFADVVGWISPGDAEDATSPRGVANAHTLFNGFLLVAFLPLTRAFAWLTERLVPISETESDTVEPEHLDEAALDSPSLALDRARQEILRMGEHAKDMLCEARTIVIEGSAHDLAALADKDDFLDVLHDHVVDYLRRVSQGSLGSTDSKALSELMEAVNIIESIGDVVETDLVAVGHKRLDARVTFSQATRSVMEDVHSAVVETLELALERLEAEDRADDEEEAEERARIYDKVDEAASHLRERLGADDPDRVDTYGAERDYVEHLKRISWYARRLTRG